MAEIEKITSKVRDRGLVEVVHQDGSIDYIDPRVIGGNVKELPKGYYLRPQFIGTVAAVCCAGVCANLGWVLPANTLDLINDDIGPSANINWVATVFTLGNAVGFLLVGRLSDIFGRKWMVLTTSGLGLIGNVIGCSAQSVNTLIAGNLCNGLAASGQLSFGIVLGELVPNRQRGPTITLVFLSAVPFSVFGPVVARSFILNTSAEWRWSYYLGIIMSMISLVLYHFLYHPPTYKQLHVEGKPKRQQLIELDHGGIFLFTAGIVLLVFGLSWGGVTYPWKSPQVLCTLIFGIGTLIFLGFYEAHIVKGTALIPPRLFKNIGYIAIVACATIGAMVFFSLTILWPAVIKMIYTTDVLSIGWQSCVVGGGVLLGQTLSGLSISYIPKVNYQTIIAASIAFVFITALCSVSEDRHAEFIIFGIIGCIAIGFVDNITFPGVTLVIEPQDIGLASGVLGSIRACGGAIAQALYTSVLNNKLSIDLPKFVAPAALAAGLSPETLPDLLLGIQIGNWTIIPGNSAVVDMVQKEVRRACISSFRLVFLVSIPFGVLLVVAALFVPNMEGFLDGEVAKRLQDGKGRETVVGKRGNGDSVESGEEIELRDIGV